MDWTATIMDFGGIDPARANPDFDGMSFKDTFYNGNDVSPSPRKDLFMFMNGSPAVSFNQFHEIHYDRFSNRPSLKNIVIKDKAPF